MNELFAKLKRLFEPQPRPAEPIGEPTADRPPPEAAEPTHVEPPRTEAPPAEPAQVAATPVEEAPAPPSRPRAHADVDEQLAEVRAALEAVAQDPVTASEPAAEVFPEAPEPPEPPIPPSVVAQPAAPGAVVDSLVLTLATPPTAFTVAKASATLGRGQENTIRLDDLSVSRRHARIAYRQGGYWLSDLGSMGGTWVDGTRLNAPRRIAAGDVIDIGLCRLSVSFVGGAAKAESKKSTSKPPSEVTAQVRRRR